MFPNDFRRIALAQGLLPDCDRRPPSGADGREPPPPPAPRAPEPCEEREHTA